MVKRSLAAAPAATSKPVLGKSPRNRAPGLLSHTSEQSVMLAYGGLNVGGAWLTAEGGERRGPFALPVEHSLHYERALGDGSPKGSAQEGLHSDHSNEGSASPHSEAAGSGAPQGGAAGLPGTRAQTNECAHACSAHAHGGLQREAGAEFAYSRFDSPVTQKAASCALPK